MSLDSATRKGPHYIGPAPWVQRVYTIGTLNWTGYALIAG